MPPRSTGNQLSDQKTLCHEHEKRPLSTVFPNTSFLLELLSGALWCDGGENPPRDKAQGASVVLETRVSVKAGLPPRISPPLSDFLRPPSQGRYQDSGLASQQQHLSNNCKLSGYPNGMLRRECPAWTGFRRRMKDSLSGAEEERLALGNYSDCSKSLKWKFPLRHQGSTDGKFQSKGPGHYVYILKQLPSQAERPRRRT